MPTTYTWTPTQLAGYPTYEGLTDVVVTVSYTVVASDGTYSAKYDWFEKTPLNPDAPFIPYDQLTPEIVIGWVKDAMGADAVANLEASLQGQIDIQINPPVTPEVLPMPWIPPMIPQQTPVLVADQAAVSDTPAA